MTAIRPCVRSARTHRAGGFGSAGWRRLVWLAAVVPWVWSAPPAASRCPPPPAPAGRVADPDATAPTVLLIGDSNIFGALGHALERRLRARGLRVERFGKPTSGLSRPDFFDWPREGARRLAVTDPDIVIFMVGGNDHQRLEAPGGTGTRVRWAEADAWREEYTRRVREMARLLRGGGRRVFFLSPTNRAPRIDREDAFRISRVQEHALEGVDDVTWIDMIALTTDARGRWLDRGVGADGCWQIWRRPDGIHLTDEGGELVAEHLIAEIDARGLVECTERDRPEPAPAPAR